MKQLYNLFKQNFNSEPVFFRAPGRINLIGEHTDYNNGFVMPAAIDKAVCLAIQKAETNTCTIIANDLQEQESFNTSELIASTSWSTYIKGVIDGFNQLGCTLDRGVHAIFTSNIPIGAGISSSAALSCCFALAINELFQFRLDKLQLARIAQSAEHNFAGVQCGIMDQYASLFGKKDAVILLDCKNLTHQYFPLQLTGYSLLLVDTKVKHTLASSAYNKRRASCEEGVHIIQQKNNAVQSLRDVTPAMLQAYQHKLSPETFMRCNFVTSEMERTLQASALLQENKIQQFGALMFETHEGLQKQYEVSCSELDLLVDIAKQLHITGARMMGGGFGGCTINIIKNSKVDFFKDEISKNYSAKFGINPAFYDVALDEGASRLFL